MKSLLALALALAPLAAAKTYFKETFDSDTVPDRWVVSEKRQDYGKWGLSHGKFFADPKSSRGLQTTEDAHFYAISAPFDEELDNSNKPLVVQFSVKFEQTIDCGGGYLKLIPKPFVPNAFDGDTKYNIMFGPDICGADRKVHVILNYNGKNHLIKKSIAPGTDQMTHLYTFILNPDQTYRVLVDQKEEAKGSILEDWDLLPPVKIPDPNAKKPDNWVDKPSIDDPRDVKPADWDNAPEFIADLSATKPDDWDTDMDGEWEAPKIANPSHKGQWKPKQIPNPDYKGPWLHPEIDNPDYKIDTRITAYKTAYIGFDLWQVKSGTIFDNVIVTDSVEDADVFAKDTYGKDIEGEKKAKEAIDAEEEKRIQEMNAKERAKQKAASDAAASSSSADGSAAPSAAGEGSSSDESPLEDLDSAHNEL